MWVWNIAWTNYIFLHFKQNLMNDNGCEKEGWTLSNLSWRTMQRATFNWLVCVPGEKDAHKSSGLVKKCECSLMAYKHLHLFHKLKTGVKVWPYVTFDVTSYWQLPQLSTASHGIHQWMEFAQLSLRKLSCQTPFAVEGYKTPLKTQEKANKQTWFQIILSNYSS